MPEPSAAPRVSFSRRAERAPDHSPVLRFSPAAWAKLVYLRDLGDTEVGGFGVAAPDDLLYVENVRLVRQTCSAASVAFDDEAVADLFDELVDEGLALERFARIWIHTHPGAWAKPSLIDEETFRRVFGRNPWAVMFILAQDGQSYARLRFNVGPGGAATIPVEVDYRRPFPASEHAAWEYEYLQCVRPAPLRLVLPFGPLAAAGPEHGMEEGCFGADEADWLVGWDDPLPDPLSLEETTDVDDR